MINTIKFSHKYRKMPTTLVIEDGRHTVLDVFTTNLDELDREFLKYDTVYFDESDEKNKYFPLNFRKAIVIVIFSHKEFKIATERRIWTTIRRYTPPKYEYYRKMIGKRVEIVIQ